MTTFVRIDRDIVVEVIAFNPDGFFHPGITWIDASTVSGIAQGWVYDGGSFSPPPPPPTPAPSQVAAGLLLNGLTITSTSNPGLNATYATDSYAQASIVGIETSLNAGRGFPPNGAQTLSHPDVAGNPHVFSQQEFTNFAAAVRDFIYACTIYGRGATTTVPTTQASIG